jgi:two-component system sensor histidine kinase AlgZ
LPDFRNIGVILRVVLLVNAAAALTVFVREDDAASWPVAVGAMAGFVELPLFVVVLGLYALQPLLERLAPARVWLLVTGLSLLVAWLAHPVVGAHSGVPLWRWLGWALLAALAARAYFEYRGRLFSPALTEARLHALTARIRPHFLFNSLNGVLGIIRDDPRRAEQVLEEIADMFRVLMKEHRELVPLNDEIELCHRYLDVERLRLGERLVVAWDLEFQPINALVPPLLLQPLLENAVYHGIEPSPEPGDIAVRVARRGGEVIIEVSNPIVDHPRAQRGNRMAQANIKERLALFFDLEADMSIDRRGGRYTVRIRFPYRRVKS